VVEEEEEDGGGEVGGEGWGSESPAPAPCCLSGEFCVVLEFGRRVAARENH
jgi:hypothetical protein